MVLGTGPSLSKAMPKLTQCLNKYKFSVITCEHNYTPSRGKIYELFIGE